MKRDAALISGFCNPGNPADSHDRCKVAAPGFTCACTCHALAEVDLVTPTGVLATDAEPGTDDWFAARRLGITGTDLPKILGITKYGNALSVWLDKRDELDDDAGEAALWGNLLEEPVGQEWARRNTATVSRVGVLHNVDEPWMRASLDRIVDPGACPDGGFDCGLEIKTRNAFKAADWADGIPDDTLAQVAWGRRVTGLDHMHVAALIGGQRLVSFRYDRDEQLEQYLVDAARPVWQSVVEGTPPEAHPDSEGVLLDLLDRLYAKRAGDRDLDPDEAPTWIAQYEEGLDLERQAKRLKTEAKTALVQMLDDGETGLLHGAPAFAYSTPAPGFTVPAAELRRLRDEQPDLWQALHDDGVITTTNPGPRFDLKRAKKGSAA